MTGFDPLEAFDGWELEEKLDHVRRILTTSAASEASRPPLSDRLQGWPAADMTVPSSPIPWVLTKLAVSAITCGAILAAWWWIAGREDLIKPALASLAIGHLAWLGNWWWQVKREAVTKSCVAGPH